MTFLDLPVELRDQYGVVADVDRKERLVDMIVVPYNEETVVEYRGQLVTESLLPGAFAGITVNEKSPRFTVNRDHDGQRTVGIARHVEDTPEGLRATVFISKTLTGDEALTLAEDGILQPSVGMRVHPKDQRWSDGNRRRQILRAGLDHIALVPQQAYNGARVLAVRSAATSAADEARLWMPQATPLLDEALAYVAEVNASLAR